MTDLWKCDFQDEELEMIVTVAEEDNAMDIDEVEQKKENEEKRDISSDYVPSVPWTLNDLQSEFLWRKEAAMTMWCSQPRDEAEWRHYSDDMRHCYEEVPIVQEYLAAVEEELKQLQSINNYFLEQQNEIDFNWSRQTLIYAKFQ